MSDNEPTVKYSEELSKSAFVPTAVNIYQLSRAQADIAKLCAQIAVDEEFAFRVWDALYRAGYFED